MSFYNEIEKLFEGDNVTPAFCVHIYGEKFIAIEGYKKILAFSDTEIVVLLANGSKLLLSGVKMVIKRLEKGEIVIGGEFLSLEKREA